MASLIGRILRISCFALALVALALTAPLALAAPYAAYVMDARTGETLYSKNAESRLHPASLTKMMTLYIVFEEISAGRISLDSKVTISKHAAAQPPSRLGLKPGQKIALRYLIRAAAVKSANDAATALGEFVGGGSEAAFAKRMTRTAKALGMRNSSFRNANGLTADGHLSTAKDMSILGRRLFYDFPQFYNIFSRRTADAGVAEVRNTNTRFLDAYKGADGIKTGYTNAAGFNLTASAERGGKRVIASVFGGTSTANRNAKMAELLDLGFGAAPGGVKEQPPEAPAYDDPETLLVAEADAAAIDAAVAAAEEGIDVAGAEGGSAKTVRVSGEVRTSLRPKARPAPTAPQPVVVAAADPLAAAIAEGVDGVLAEAIATTPPPGTLDAQAEVLAAVPAETAPIETAAEAAAPPPPPGTLDAQAEALAMAPATLDAQALALTATPAPATLDAQALALAAPDAPAEALAAAAVPEPDAALIAARPRSRPVAAAPNAASVAEPAPAPAPTETVITDAGTADTDGEDPAPVQIAGADAVPALPDVTAVQSVAAAAPIAPALNATAPIALAAAQPAKRRAPIFETAKAAPPAATPDTPEVVVRASTSGGRHFGVNVGSFTSRYEAERALLKTALAESATLNTGLRKITQKGGSYHANFMGLSEDEADLACRRLRARAIECETLG